MGNSEDKSLTDKGLTLRLTSTSLGTSRSGSSDLNFSFFVLTLERSAILAASKMQSLRHGFAKRTTRILPFLTLRFKYRTAYDE